MQLKDAMATVNIYVKRVGLGQIVQMLLHLRLKGSLRTLNSKFVSKHRSNCHNAMSLKGIDNCQGV